MPTDGASFRVSERNNVAAKLVANGPNQREAAPPSFSLCECLPCTVGHRAIRLIPSQRGQKRKCLKDAVGYRAPRHAVPPS